MLLLIVCLFNFLHYLLRKVSFWLCFPIHIVLIHYTVCTHIVNIALTLLCRSHLLPCHDWLIMYNVSTLMIKLLFRHYLQQVWKQQEKWQNLDLLSNLEILARTKMMYDHPMFTNVWKFFQIWNHFWVKLPLMTTQWIKMFAKIEKILWSTYFLQMSHLLWMKHMFYLIHDRLSRCTDVS